MTAKALPTGWTRRRLRFDAALNPVKSELGLADDAEVSFVPMEAVGELGGLRLDEQRSVDEVYTGYTYFRENDVVIAKITPCFENGKGALAIGLMNDVAFGTTELHVVRATHKLDPAFLFYVTLAHDFRCYGASEMLGAGGQKRVPERFLKDWRPPLPSIETQRRIAIFLDEKTTQIDGLIEKKRALLERLAEKRQAIVTQAVTKGLDDAAPMKESGIDWLGQIPAHWDVWPLKRYLARSLYGVSAPLQPTGEVAILRMGNLQDGELDFGDLRFLDEVEAEIVLQPQDVIFNRTNSLSLVGKAAIYRGDFEGLLSLASYLVLLRFNDRYDPEYANYIMGSNVLMALARTLALPSIGQANLNPSRYAAIRFPVPPLAEQTKIVSYVADQSVRVKELDSQVRASITKLMQYRHSLIAAAVVGQIEGLC